MFTNYISINIRNFNFNFNFRFKWKSISWPLEVQILGFEELPLMDKVFFLIAQEENYLPWILGSYWASLLLVQVVVTSSLLFWRCCVCLNFRTRYSSTFMAPWGRDMAYAKVLTCRLLIRSTAKRLPLKPLSRTIIIVGSWIVTANHVIA